MVNDTTLSDEKLPVYVQNITSYYPTYVYECVELTPELKATFATTEANCSTFCATLESADQKNRINMCMSEIT